MSQKGFSLIELMLSLLIGLIMSLGIASLAISYDSGRKGNVSSNTANANGTTAAETLNTSLQMAGAGLISNYSPICVNLYSTAPNYTNSGVALDILRVDTTTDPNSNHVIFAYGNGGSAASMLKVSTSMATANDDIGVPSVGSISIGNDILLAYSSTGNGTDCTLRTVTAPLAANATAGMVNIGLDATQAHNKSIAGAPTYSADFYVIPEQVFSYQEWYAENAMLKFKDRITGVVNFVAEGVIYLRAQYGVDSGVGLTWQDQPPSQLQYLKAVRTAMVVRSDSREKQADPGNCTSTPSSTILFDSWLGPDSGSIDISTLTSTTGAVLVPDWRCYYYKTYTTVTPLRSLTWSTAQ